jgi:hypothetical protein
MCFCTTRHHIFGKRILEIFSAAREREEETKWRRRRRNKFE